MYAKPSTTLKSTLAREFSKGRSGSDPILLSGRGARTGQANAELVRPMWQTRMDGCKTCSKYPDYSSCMEYFATRSNACLTA